LTTDEEADEAGTWRNGWVDGWRVRGRERWMD